jgi:hypothetical protein
MGMDGIDGIMGMDGIMGIIMVGTSSRLDWNDRDVVNEASARDARTLSSRV